MEDLARPLVAASAFASAVFALHLATLDGRDRMAHRLLAAFFGLYAVQLVLFAAHLADPAAGWSRARAVLALIAMAVLYLFFRAARDGRLELKPVDALHAVPAAAGAAVILARNADALDGVIFAAEIGYGAWFIWLLRRGPDAFARLGPHRERAYRWLQAVAALFVATVAVDAAIYVHIARGGAITGSYPFAVASVLLALFVAYGVLGALGRPSLFEWLYESAAISAAPPTQEASTAERDLAVRIDTALSDPKILGDEDLTLLRLSRRLGEPPRRVSEAVNRTFERSFSDHLNLRRVERAMALLRDDPERPLLDVMMDAGYRSKSNFHKRFKAHAGVSPGAFARNLANKSVKD